MKTEIHLENKAKFFAQHWGQSVLCHTWLTVPVVIAGNLNDVVDGSPIFPYITLKPLSSITDEDAMEVCRIARPDVKWKNYSTSDRIKFALRFSLVYIFVIDYLRSKGYALPWMGLSVDEIVEAGWIKLKEI